LSDKSFGELKGGDGRLFVVAYGARIISDATAILPGKESFKFSKTLVAGLF